VQIVALAVAGTVVVIPRAASAGPSDDRLFVELKRSGDRSMESLQFGPAIDAYSRALALQPDPALLYNLGRAHEGAGHFAVALDYFERFKATAPPALRAQVSALDELIERAAARTGKLTVEVVSPPHAKVRIAKGEPASAPMSARLDAGEVEIEVSADGYETVRRSARLAGGDSQTVRVSLPRVASPEAPAPAPAPASSSILSKWWFWAGGAAIVVGAGVLTVALVKERSPTQGDLPPGQVSGPLVRF
jgi:hypothetical protein